MLNLKAIRKAKGISQQQLANKLGISRSTVAMWETGSSAPDFDTLVKLAKYFNVSTDYLLGKSAFKNPMELFEHWSGHNDPNFESAFDFGELLKEVRELQGVSQQEVSEALGITESDVDDIENGILPLNHEWAEKYATFLGTSVEQIFIDNGMGASLNDIPLEVFHHYQEQGMSEGEIAVAYAKFRKAEYEDAQRELGEEHRYKREHLKKYSRLDDHGRYLVDTVTSIEYERIRSIDDGVNEQAATYDIPLLGKTAAGAPLSYGDPSYETIGVKTIPKGAEFALTVSGDSMEPLIKDGSIIFVKPQPAAENGQIVVAEVDGEVTCKKFYRDEDGGVELRSINPQYGPIVEFNSLRIIGKVIL